MKKIECPEWVLFFCFGKSGWSDFWFITATRGANAYILNAFKLKLIIGIPWSKNVIAYEHRTGDKRGMLASNEANMSTFGAITIPNLSKPIEVDENGYLIYKTSMSDKTLTKISKIVLIVTIVLLLIGFITSIYSLL